MAPVYRFLAERIAERLGRPVDAAAYDDIRALLAVIEAAGWTSLTQRRSGVDARAVGEAVVTCRTGEQYGG